MSKFVRPFGKVGHTGIMRRVRNVTNAFHAAIPKKPKPAPAKKAKQS